MLLPEIATIVHEDVKSTSEQISKRLIAAALEKERPRQDNITVIVLQGQLLVELNYIAIEQPTDSDDIITRPLKR